MLDIITNLVLLAVILGGLAYVAYKIYSFTKMSKGQQVKSVKEWLLWAVAEAEKVYGSGTGVLKLRYVYDMFLTKFNFLSDIIRFDEFSDLVDDALDSFKEILKTNEKINNYVDKSNEEAK